MQKETVIREIPIVKAVASEGVVLTVLSYLKNGDIEKALASFAEEFRFKGHGIGLELPTRRDWLNSSRRRGSYIQTRGSRLMPFSRPATT
jgi:hypothetical protein